MKTDMSLIYGVHSVKALLTESKNTVQSLIVGQGKRNHALKTIVALAEKAKIPIEVLSAQELNQLSGDGVHQGVIARCINQQSIKTDLKQLLEDAPDNPLFLILDGVQDPHNLGAILRVADASGVCGVIAPKDRAVGLTPVVHKVACGAAATVPYVQVTNLARTMRELQKNNIWLYGASEHADQNLYEMELTGGVAIVLGAEGAGLRHLTTENCDQLMRIPMKGQVDSLNVSVAAGVCLFEVVRQRLNSLT